MEQKDENFYILDSDKVTNDDINQYITNMTEYKELCKKFKYKQTTLIKRIVEIINVMANF